MAKNEVEVSVVLPCYNEKENILELIKAIHVYLKEYYYEIIVVDDNSPDGTFDLVRKSGLPYVKSFQRKQDPSLAKSIRYGIENSTGAIIIVMDSDFNHKPEYLSIMVDNIKYYDCVSASRLVYGGDMRNRFRHICSWLFNIFSRILTRTFVTDSLFGYFAIKRSVLDQIDFEKVFWGYGDYCIRLMYYLQKNKVSILQIPVVLGDRLGGQGNTQMFGTLLQYIKEVFKLVYCARKGLEGKNDI